MLSGMSFVISQGPLFLDVCRVQTIGHIEEYTGIDSSLSFARSVLNGTWDRIRGGPPGEYAAQLSSTATIGIDRRIRSS